MAPAGRIGKDGKFTQTGEAGYCPKCDTYMADGPDACLGIIPGVSHACCGHGDDESAYVILGGEPDSPAWAIDTVALRGGAACALFALVREHGKWEEGKPDTVWVMVESDARSDKELV